MKSIQFRDHYVRLLNKIKTLTESTAKLEASDAKYLHPAEYRKKKRLYKDQLNINTRMQRILLQSYGKSIAEEIINVG